MTGNTATADVDISASPDQVWRALTEPEQISKYLFGARVETTWEPGTPITWSGELDGRSYEDKGEVVECVPEQRLTVTHYSPLSGREDTPENYHRLTYELREDGDRTHVHLEQDNNPSEEALADARDNWEIVLRGLKECVERG